METLTQQEETFNIRTRWLVFNWVIIGLLTAVLYISYKIATHGQVYPNLSQAPIVCVLVGFVWIGWLAEAWRQTTVISLGAHQFTVKKWAQAARQFNYESIEGFHEHTEVDRNGSYRVLSVYLKDYYFSIKSTDFEAYEVLKTRLTEHRAAVPRQQVITRAERNRLRWLIAGLIMVIIANIVFGYVAYNPKSKQPAQLVSLTSTLDRIRLVSNRSGLKGFTVQLRDWPDFEFYISRKAYAEDLRTLEQEVTMNRSIRVLIRESDYRKKLLKTDPLTIGDKYDNFNQISVFGVDQLNGLRLRATVPALEPTHTNPVQRTILLGILLLFCWTGWAYVDRQKVLDPS
ncbi:hypothetical protein [Spirosoma gilvum]